MTPQSSQTASQNSPGFSTLHRCRATESGTSTSKRDATVWRKASMRVAATVLGFQSGSAVGTPSVCLRRESLPQGVLGDGAGLDELVQVVGPARLRPDARQTVSAEGLATHDGADDVAVHVDVAGAQLPA